MIGAVAGAIAALAVGGVGLARAQESPSTTTPPGAETPAPDATTPDARDHRCDDRGGDAPAADATQL